MALRKQTGKDSLNVRQRKTLAGVAAGKSVRQAAVEAGYAQSVAARGVKGICKNPQSLEEFRRAIAEIEPIQDTRARLLKGLAATEKRLVKITRIKKRLPDGGGTVEQEAYEFAEVPAWRERRAFLELQAKLSGWLTPAETTVNVNAPAESEEHSLRVAAQAEALRQAIQERLERERQEKASDRSE